MPLGSQRDALSARMIGLLETAAFSGASVDEHTARDLASQGQDLLARVQDLAGGR